MTAGAALAARSLAGRRAWEQANRQVAVMLDWDDVQAVTTRSPSNSADGGDVAGLLRQYQANGATHLSIPELTLARLMLGGQTAVTHGPDSRRIYLQFQRRALAERVATELTARLPHIQAELTGGHVISFAGDLPAVAEVGLGFDPTQSELARQAGLSPVPRPVGYSWVQPDMIDRTFDQAAALGAKIIAVQGNLVPGHEFKIQHTVEAMRRNGLTFAYFRESRHQKGDWFLAKHLAEDGLVLLAHEFTPTQLLDEDLHTAAYRWGNLAVEAGVRLFSVRFFRILHAADPLESVTYVHQILHALHHARLVPMDAPPPDLTLFQPRSARQTLAAAGLSTAGAVGLSTDLLPLPEWLKLVKVMGAALVLGGLPLIKWPAGQQPDHHPHPHHPEHDHAHHDHHHHKHHHGPAPAPTAYAQKGVALAAAMAFPAATAAINGPDAACVLAQSGLISAAGAAALGVTTVDTDYLLGIEEYRGWNLDWLVPLGLAAVGSLFKAMTAKPMPENRTAFSWLPLAGAALAGLAGLAGKLPADLPGALDREHGHAHTHHLSKFQQKLGDAKMVLSPRPLRKWAFLAPLGAVGRLIFKQTGHGTLAPWAALAAAAGQVATLTGFRQGQRPLDLTTRRRSKSWFIGAVLAGMMWFIISVLTSKWR